MKEHRIPLILILLIFSFAAVMAQRPAWVTNHPLESNYYSGIGFSEKSTNDWAQIARNNALADIASEISVTITNQFTHTLMEKAGLIADEVQSSVQTSTAAKLEGYEQVDSWDNGNEYWVYYRLSKARYRNMVQKQKSAAIDRGMDFYERSLQNETKGNIGTALNESLQALSAIGDFWSEALETEFRGKNILLFNTFYSHLQSMFTAIDLLPVEPQRTAKKGMALEKPLQINALYKVRGDKKVPAKDLPISFRFIRGGGDLVQSAVTGSNGNAYSTVAQISDPDEIQIIYAAPNMDKLLLNRFTDVQIKFLGTLTLPEAEFQITVKPTLIAFKVDELHLGKSSGILYLEPKIKKVLTDMGYQFTGTLSKADFLIEIKAASRQGSKTYNMFSVFLDLNLTVTEPGSGNQIYKDSKEGIKGIQLSYDKADIKAYENAAKEVESMIPEIFK